MTKKTRTEKDSLGEIQVPSEALYGAQTQRAVENFSISSFRMPRTFLKGLGLLKACCAEANLDEKLLERDPAKAIIKAALEVSEGQYDDQFPIDVFQTGSGTSTNMNANEVIAHLASKHIRQRIHPNDHVNMSQSSNDVIPTSIHISTAIAIQEQLEPALDKLHTTIVNKAKTLSEVVKTGRTHLMDAMPLTFEQELSGWAAQIDHCRESLRDTTQRIHRLGIGGTAIGTGINAPTDFGKRVAKLLAKRSGIPFKPTANTFMAISSQDAIVELSGQLKVMAVSLTKIANDLRLMNSGPLAGFADITLPILQPGSSIMPGKINPVIPEAVVMACAQVMGNDTTIGIAGAAGNFQLNTMLPVIAYNILLSIELIARSAEALADKAIAGFKVNEEHVEKTLAQNPILITALNTVIGYERGAEIAKRAYQEKRPILEVAKEMTHIDPKELEQLLDPKQLTSNK